MTSARRAGTPMSRSTGRRCCGGTTWASRAPTPDTPARWRSTWGCAGAGGRSPARRRDGPGRLHRRRPHAHLGVRPDRRRRRRLLRRPGGADGDTWCGVLRPPVGARAALRQGGPVHRGAVRRAARLPARHGEPGGAARGTGRGDLRAGGRDRHDATVRPGSREARRQPVRGPDGDAAGHGLGVRAASPRARVQRRGVRRLAGRPGRARDEKQRSTNQCGTKQRGKKQCSKKQRGRVSPGTGGFRAEVRDWLSAHVPAGPLPSVDTAEGFARHREWERELAAARLSVVSWPPRYGGRGASLLEWLVFEEEYHAAAAPVRVGQNGLFLLAPTLMRHGTAEQCDRLLPPMARADEVWAQAWSEPEAGSDLAAVRASAVRVNAGRAKGGWLLSGTKTWSSRAAFADKAFGLFRSGPGRHDGLTYLLFGLRADGVTVRPIRQLGGETGFAEIFLDE